MDKTENINANLKVKISVSPTHVLRIRLCEGIAKKLANMDYTLTIGSQDFTGKTNSDGVLEHKMNYKEGTSYLHFHDLQIPLEISVLLPIKSIKGVQQRLSNLGYECGRIDGVIGPKTKHAVKAFQRDHLPLEVNGIVGADTEQALLKAYGS